MQGKSSFMGQSPNVIMTILSDREYMAGVREKLNLIAQFSA